MYTSSTATKYCSDQNRRGLVLKFGITFFGQCVLDGEHAALQMPPSRAQTTPGMIQWDRCQILCGSGILFCINTAIITPQPRYSSWQIKSTPQKGVNEFQNDSLSVCACHGQTLFRATVIAFLCHGQTLFPADMLTQLFIDIKIHLWQNKLGASLNQLGLCLRMYLDEIF